MDIAGPSVLSNENIVCISTSTVGLVLVHVSYFGIDQNYKCNSMHTYLAVSPTEISKNNKINSQILMGLSVPNPNGALCVDSQAAPSFYRSTQIWTNCIAGTYFSRPR